VLSVEERPTPVPGPDEILIQVKAFGINHAEIYFRQGAWGDVPEITGIECVGVVAADPGNRLVPGTKVLAMVGGMGRARGGSYAEFVSVPRSNVVAIETTLGWEELAAIPESYATAWVSLHGILRMQHGQTVLIRGATSALGQAAVNIAAANGLHIIATTRQISRARLLEALGAHEVLFENPQLAARVRELHPGGIDAGIDIVGTSTVLDSLAMVRRGGEICLVGFLGGGEPLACQPVFQIPSGVRLSVFASALALGGPEFPLGEIPFQQIVDAVAAGKFTARPARVFPFEMIPEAHRLVESGQAGGKVVVILDGLYSRPS
jgi:NADPH:quinone reductase-like Zn-dependent oxidoreductase